MRLLGAFSGGVWGANFLADLGNGRFDGAWLVQNFQFLKPESAIWEKLYTVFANPEQERERFLEFERWWNGFYFLSREELVATVQDLFVGNKLETGEIQVDCDCKVDLRRIRKPKSSLRPTVTTSRHRIRHWGGFPQCMKAQKIWSLPASALST
ncbi:DUF3141 domain-containing protein [Cupriavidus basilensis]